MSLIRVADCPMHLHRVEWAPRTIPLLDPTIYDIGHTLLHVFGHNLAGYIIMWDSQIFLLFHNLLI